MQQTKNSKTSAKTPIYLLFLILTIIAHIMIQVSYTATEDFCQDYFAAKLFLHHTSIYSPIPCGPLLYNVHPPIATLLFIPFTIFPIQIAAMIWGLLSLTCYLLSGVLLLKILHKLSIRSVLLFSTASLFWSYFLNAAWFRNTGLLFLFLITLAYILKQRNHSYISGFIVGILTLLKIWPVILLSYALLTGQKKVFTSAVSTIIIGTLFSLWIFQPLTYSTYFTTIVNYEKNWLTHPSNISLLGTTVKILTFLPANTTLNIGYIITIIATIATYYFIYTQNKYLKTKKSHDLLEGLIITNSLLIFPLVWEWNIIFLLFPATIILKNVPKQHQPLWWHSLWIFSLTTFLNPIMLYLRLFQHNIAPQQLKEIITHTNIFLTAGIITFSIAQIILIIKSKTTHTLP